MVGPLTTRSWRSPTRWAAWALPAALLLAGGAWAWAARGEQWWAQALRSGMFIRCGLLALGSLAGLELVLLAMFRLGRLKRQAMAGDERGVAIIEFALLFPFAMALVLILIQTSLAMVGNLFVHYAAYCGARSAVVWVPANLVESSGVTPPEPRNRMESPGQSYKYDRIRSAAVLALAPVGATIDAGGGGTVDSRVLEAGLAELFRQGGDSPPGWLGEQMRRRIEYADQHTLVTVAPPANGFEYGSREDIVVTVEHEFFLAMPYVRHVFKGEELADRPGHYYSKITAQCRLMNQGRDDSVQIEYTEDGELMLPR